jgi:type I restriction enzyme S subunit
MIDVSPQELDIVRRILRKHLPDCEVWAFGSRTQQTAKTWSDRDLAVITDTPLPLAVRWALAEDFVNSELRFRVDVLDWARTEAAFRRVVEADKVVVQPAITPSNSGASAGSGLGR